MTFLLFFSNIALLSYEFPWHPTSLHLNLSDTLGDTMVMWWSFFYHHCCNRSIFPVAFAEIVGTKDKVFCNFTCENNDNHQHQLLKCSYGDNDGLELWIFYLRCWTVVEQWFAPKSWYASIMICFCICDDNTDDDDIEEKDNGNINDDNYNGKFNKLIC